MEVLIRPGRRNLPHHAQPAVYLADWAAVLGRAIHIAGTVECDSACPRVSAVRSACSAGVNDRPSEVVQVLVRPGGRNLPHHASAVDTAVRNCTVHVSGSIEGDPSSRVLTVSCGYAKVVQVCIEPSRLAMCDRGYKRKGKEQGNSNPNSHRLSTDLRGDSMPNEEVTFCHARAFGIGGHKYFHFNRCVIGMRATI